MMFPYSLEGAAKTWYEKEPPNSILTWEDLVTKFVNQFFPPSKTTHLKNKISRFTQKFDESFSEDWERFKESLELCPHHGFTELTQVDTFYNGLNDNDQDSLNAAAGGNLLSKTTREALNIIENKSKVRYSRNKPNASRMNTTSRESVSKTDERIDKLADQLSTLVEIVSTKVVTPAPVKAVEEIGYLCRGFIDVYGEEITLRVDNEAVTFNLDQTTRYSSTNDKSVNRIDIIDAVCEEYAPKLLGFSNNDSSGGNPTPTSEPFTSEFILEEIKAYLKDDSISPEIDYADCDPEEDICLIDFFLNNDPFQLPPMDLKQSEVTKEKSSIEEPPELELKDLPSHLEYAYLEKNNNKLTVNYCNKVFTNTNRSSRPGKKLLSHARMGTFAVPSHCHWLCNAPGTFQRCMMAIFHDMIEKTVEVFMDDFSVFGDSFDSCLSNLEKMLKRCEDTNLVLNWEKCHFMCREGIVLGHKISKSGIEVGRAKVNVIAKLPHPATVKGVRSFLGHAGFYRRFIQDFSKIARPMTHLLEKETLFVFSKDCIDAFQTLKKKLTEAPILVVVTTMT
ncbi:reverse transcriptase domain-containing protein [Tanacetum coccineum]